MATRIFKYKVLPGLYTHMPKGAQPLSVGQQGTDIVCWAIVDDQQPGEPRQIAAYGTGHPLNGDPGRFIGTVQMDDGLVFHFFDQGEAG